MTPAEYQRLAMRTLNPEVDTLRERLLNGAVGLAGEAGETADLIKKYAFQGKPLALDALLLELGDALWYITEIADALGWSLEEVMEANVAKLQQRYPAGFARRPG